MKTIFVLPVSGFGYEVDQNGIKIRQESAPALPGDIVMTEQQATLLADLVERKIINHLRPSVTVSQINSLWQGLKTVQQIINDELGI